MRSSSDKGNWGVDVDSYYMGLALKEAEEAYGAGEVPVGAVVVGGGRVLSRAHNMVERLGDVTAHAEILALTQASAQLRTKYLEGCVLYVTLEPCPMCAGALYHSRVSVLCYGAGDERMGYGRHAPSLLHPRCEVRGGVRSVECGELLRAFFASRRG